MMLIVRIFFLLLFLLIEQAFLAIITEKSEFYIKNKEYSDETNEIIQIENEKIDEISKKYKIENLYYGEDKHNIFKRSKIFLFYIQFL